MSKELIKAILNFDFYEKYKDKLSEDYFQDNTIKWLYQTIVKARKSEIKNLNIQELKALHKEYNPASTEATKRNLDIFYQELENLDISQAVGEELVLAQYKLIHFTQLAQLAMDAGDNKEISLDQIQSVLNKLKELSSPSIQEEEFVSTDVEVLLNEVENEYKWKIHLNPLREVIDGIGEGVFGIIAARPNAGKTGFCVSLIFQPGGFLDQGAKVHYIANEEAGVRTMLRGISSYAGMTKEEIISNKQEANQIFSKIKKNMFLKDLVGMDLNGLENYIKTHDIDILFIDQLDKIRLEGSFAGEHDRIRSLYTNVRELAKKYSIAILGVCQAGNDAEGKLYYGFECLENSRTGKAAECDICICLGKESFSTREGEDTGFRMANVVKNKLTGIEKPVGFILNRMLSRISA